MTTQTRDDQPAQRAMQAWQDGLNALFGGYGQQTAQIAGFWGVRLDQGRINEAVRRITDELREVIGAQFAVTREWMQAPYWFTGASSPTNLQASYTRLFEAYNRLFAAYTAALMPVQSAAIETAERAADTARAVIDTQARTAREVTEEMTEAGAAATE